MTTPTVQQLQQYAELLEELTRRKRIEQNKHSIMTFAETYFADRIMKSKSPPFHYEIAEEIHSALMDTEKAHYIAVAAPRSHAKSMLGTVISTIWTVVHKQYNYILIISATQEISKQLLAVIKNELMNNERLIADYGDMYSKETWNQFEVVCKNGVKIQAAGAGDSLRGLTHLGDRPGLILIDDLEKDPDVFNANYRDQREDWLNSVCIPLGNPGKTHVLYLGTILHSDSVLNRTMKNDPRFKSYRYSAVEKFPDNMHLWEKWSEMLNERTMDADDEEDSAYRAAQKARQFYEDNKTEMTRGSKVLWPERMSLYDLLVIWATKRKSFLTEYQNTPRDSTTAIFNNFVFYDNLPPLEECDVFGSCDPSLGKSKRADLSAIVTVAKHRKSGVIYVVDVNAKRRNPDTIIEDVIRLAEVYDYKEFVVEAVQFQEFFGSQLQQRAQLAGVFLPVRPIKPTVDKTLRISSLEPFITNGFIRFGKHHLSLVEQLKEFPSGTYDDMADALQMACSGFYQKKRSFVFDAV